MVRDSFPSLAVFSVLSDNVKSVSSQSIFALVLHIQAETAKLNHNLSGLMPNLNIIPLCTLYMHVHVVYVLHVHVHVVHVHVHVCLLSLYCDRESSSWGERVMQCIWCLTVSLSIVYKNNDDTHMQYMCTCTNVL